MGLSCEFEGGVVEECFMSLNVSLRLREVGVDLGKLFQVVF